MADVRGTLFASRYEDTSHWWELGYEAERDPDNKKRVIYHIYYAYIWSTADSYYFEATVGFNGAEHQYVGGLTMSSRSEQYGKLGTVSVDAKGPGTVPASWWATSMGVHETTFDVPPGGAPAVSVFDGSAWKDADEVTDYDSGWKTADAVSAYDGGWKES